MEAFPSEPNNNRQHMTDHTLTAAADSRQPCEDYTFADYVFDKGTEIRAFLGLPDPQDQNPFGDDF